jgi:hypothetical protein
MERVSHRCPSLSQFLCVGKTCYQFGNGFGNSLGEARGVSGFSGRSIPAEGRLVDVVTSFDGVQAGLLIINVLPGLLKAHHLDPV